MTEREWNSMEDAYAAGQDEAARSLMDALTAQGGPHCWDDASDIAAITESWLLSYGVRTRDA